MTIQLCPQHGKVLFDDLWNVNSDSPVNIQQFYSDFINLTENE